ncbi:MAG: sugar ABC transporter ATP-binding protein, partial [Treponema sp.]|nr:sugar ABC transporter ATP-binding protein [Treponema sp.]
MYKYIKELASSGSAVLFISHELEELMEHCDTLTVLRDGVIAGNLEKKEFDAALMKQMMVGRAIKGNFYRDDMDGYDEEVVLKADCITTMKDLLCFSLELHKGEILGIGGLSHCGMHTLGKALFGAEKVIDG